MFAEETNDQVERELVTELPVESDPVERDPISEMIQQATDQLEEELDQLVSGNEESDQTLHTEPDIQSETEHPARSDGNHGSGQDINVEHDVLSVEEEQPEHEDTQSDEDTASVRNTDVDEKEIDENEEDEKGSNSKDDSCDEHPKSPEQQTDSTFPVPLALESTQNVIPEAIPSPQCASELTAEDVKLKEQTDNAEQEEDDPKNVKCLEGHWFVCIICLCR